MAKEPVKLPKKGAVARIREVAQRLRNQPVSPELRDAFRKRQDKPEEVPLKKIATSRKKRDPDLGL